MLIGHRAAPTYVRSRGAAPAQIPGTWITRNLFVPDSVADIASNSRLFEECMKVARLYPGARNPRSGTLWAIISYKTAIGGEGRPEESHASGMAVDIAPMAASDKINDGTMLSIRLSEKVHFLSNLASNAAANDPAIFAEGDHLHIELSMLPGIVVAYHTYRASYKNDAQLVGTTPIEKKAFRCWPDGSTTVFRPVRSRDSSGRLRPWVSGLGLSSSRTNSKGKRAAPSILSLITK